MSRGLGDVYKRQVLQCTEVDAHVGFVHYFPTQPAEVGGVDEYLNYGAALYEETEICLRVKELGYKVFFNYDAHVWHLAADTGGCRVLDINRYIASLVHNRALLISRHLKWYHRPTAYIYLLRLVASYAFTYRNPGLFRLFAKTYKEGYKKGKLTPKYTHYANI